MIPFNKVKDTGWIDLSKYLTKYFTARPEYEPKYRKIGNKVYLKGQCYISDEPDVQSFSTKMFENLPAEMLPKGQISASGLTYADLRAYYIFISVSERTINICIDNWKVQDAYKGIDLTLFSPYLTD